MSQVFAESHKLGPIASVEPLFLISDKEGEAIVRLARRAVLEYLNSSTRIAPQEARLPSSGVFVTLSQFSSPGEQLRGCIGFPVSDKGLNESIIEASIAAAVSDPRFSPVEIKELDEIIFEVSVLTTPVELSTREPVDRRNHVTIGRDGLIIKWREFSGLLLPQVAKQLGWNINEYLRNLCHKAGIHENTWMDPSARLFKFQAEVFRELLPMGRVVRVISD